MGVDAIGHRLPELLDGLGEQARRVLWMTDPMHGNTRRTGAGQKVRVLDEMLAEVHAFFGVLTQRGLHPGGLHLELAPDSVTECVDDAATLGDRHPLPRYTTTCDPRLIPHQARTIVAATAGLAARATRAVTP